MSKDKYRTMLINKKLQLFLLQLVCHIALVWAVFSFTAVDWFWSFFVYFFTGCFGVTVTLHRYYSHKSFKFKNDLVRKFFVFCSVWGVVGDPIAWVNNHRQHHRLTDKPGDPHSPQILGFVQAQWLSMFHGQTNLRMVPDLIRDKFLVYIHQHYFKLHWTLMIVGLLFVPKIALVCYLVPAAILWNFGSLVNTINHMYGYRTYETTDNSTNNFLMGYLVWGEGWHNNHHGNPASKHFSNKWWEFDIGYQVVKMVEE